MTQIYDAPLPFPEITGISPFNVRQSDETDDISGLKATIDAVGLINPLLVHQGDGGFLVLAGGRRWRALAELFAENPARAPVVDAKIVRDATAAELRTLSAMENTHTLAMHPVRQYEAFAAIAAALPDPETALTTIAREFGLTRQHVKQRLALGRLSPKIRAAWLAGDLSAEAAKAYAEADDIAAQEAVFDTLQHWQKGDPHRIRFILFADTITGADRRAIYVGAEAYLAAGGTLRDSLFAEEQRFSTSLVEKLACEKLHAAAQEILRTEKWGFATTYLDEDSAEFEEMDDIDPDYLPGDESRLEEIRKAFQTMGHGPERAALEAEADEIEAKAICRALPIAERAKLAILADIDFQGALKITRALIPPQREDDENAHLREQDDDDDDLQTPHGEERTQAAPRTMGDNAPPPLPPSDPIGKQLRTVLDETAAAALHAVAARSMNFALTVAVAALGARWGVTTIDLKIHPRRNWTPTRELLQKIAPLSFAQALKIVADAHFNDVTTAFAELIGAAIDPSRDEKLDGALALIRIAASQSAIREDLQKNFEPALYFHAATREAAIAAIRDTEGQASAAEAGKMSKKQLTERATFVAKDFNWLPKILEDAATPPQPRGDEQPEAASRTTDARTTAEAMLDAIEDDDAQKDIGAKAAVFRLDDVAFEFVSDFFHERLMRAKGQTVPGDEMLSAFNRFAKALGHRELTALELASGLGDLAVKLTDVTGFSAFKDIRILDLDDEEAEPDPLSAEGAPPPGETTGAPPDLTPIESVERFLGDACDFSVFDAQIKAKTLHNAFTNWTALRGGEPISIQLFGALMEEAGITKHRLKTGVHYLGITLNQPATPEEEAAE